MLHIDMTLEDTRLIVDNNSGNQVGPWSVRLIDNRTCEEAHREWTDTQLAAVMALAVAGDEHPQAETLYAEAELAVAGLPLNLRPIP
jgi:hypothetical protein